MVRALSRWEKSARALQSELNLSHPRRPAVLKSQALTSDCDDAGALELQPVARCETGESLLADLFDDERGLSAWLAQQQCVM